MSPQRRATQRMDESETREISRNLAEKGRHGGPSDISRNLRRAPWRCSLRCAPVRAPLPRPIEAALGTRARRPAHEDDEDEEEDESWRTQGPDRPADRQCARPSA